MGEIICNLMEMLGHKLACYCKLISVMEKEKAYIIDMDIEALWKTCTAKQNIVKDISAGKKEIFNLIKEHYSLSDSDTDETGLLHIIRRLPIPEQFRFELIRLISDINLKKDELHMLSCENGKYVSDYLEVINDVMSTIVGFSTDRHYTCSGADGEASMPNCFINAEV